MLLREWVLMRIVVLVVGGCVGIGGNDVGCGRECCRCVVVRSRVEEKWG